jgi:hypothetical protein
LGYGGATKRGNFMLVFLCQFLELHLVHGCSDEGGVGGFISYVQGLGSRVYDLGLLTTWLEAKAEGFSLNH